MKFKKSLLIICLIICIFAVASVSATDANDTAIATTEDSLEIDQPTDDVIGVEEDKELASSGTDEVLKADEQTFSQLNTTINGNTDNDIYLDSDYKYSNGDDSFKGGIVIDRDVNIYGNGHTINGSDEARIFQINGGNVVFYNITFVNGNAGSYYGGAINGNCKAINCTFKENQAYFGGAMYQGSAVNCTFINNTASNGGAMYQGSAVNCTFSDNHADGSGGAMYQGSAVNCTFTRNYAYYGGAMNGGSAVNCTFRKNNAGFGGAMYAGSAFYCIFETGLDYIIGTMVQPSIIVSDFISTYGSGDKLLFNITYDNQYFDGENVTITVTQNGEPVGVYYGLSGDDGGWIVDLDTGIYMARLSLERYRLDSVSTNLIINKRNSILTADKINEGLSVTLKDDLGNPLSCFEVSVELNNNIFSNMTDYNGQAKICLEVPFAGAYFATVNFAGSPNYLESTTGAIFVVNKQKSVLTTENTTDGIIISLKDSNGNPISNAMLFVDLDGLKLFITNSSGQAKLSTKDLAPNTYDVIIGFGGNENYASSTSTTKVIVEKYPTQIAVSDVTAVYNGNGYLVATLKDINGNSIKGIKLTVVLNGKTYTPTTDANGQVKVSTKGLAPKAYTAKITFVGNTNYVKSTGSAKVIVKKATPKLTAKAKSFKKSVKTKKYAVTLKDNTGKAMNKAKLTLKIKNKKFTAKTNTKGKATFKIKKFTKKGTFKATVTYKGNAYYNKVTKTVKIKMK